jgi:hypothetical protein
MPDFLPKTKTEILGIRDGMGWTWKAQGMVEGEIVARHAAQCRAPTPIDWDAPIALLWGAQCQYQRQAEYLCTLETRSGKRFACRVTKGANDPIGEAGNQFVEWYDEFGRSGSGGPNKIINAQTGHRPLTPNWIKGITEGDLHDMTRAFRNAAVGDPADSPIAVLSEATFQMYFRAFRAALDALVKRKYHPL